MSWSASHTPIVNQAFRGINVINQSEKTGFKAGLKKHCLSRIITPLACLSLGAISFIYHAGSFLIKTPICLSKYTILRLIPMKVDGKFCSVGSRVPNNFGILDLTKHGLKAVAFAVETVAGPFLAFVSPKAVVWLNEKCGLTHIAPPLPPRNNVANPQPAGDVANPQPEDDVANPEPEDDDYKPPVPHRDPVPAARRPSTPPPLPPRDDDEPADQGRPAQPIPNQPPSQASKRVVRPSNGQRRQPNRPINDQGKSGLAKGGRPLPAQPELKPHVEGPQPGHEQSEGNVEHQPNGTGKTLMRQLVENVDPHKRAMVSIAAKKLGKRRKHLADQSAKKMDEAILGEAAIPPPPPPPPLDLKALAPRGFSGADLAAQAKLLKKHVVEAATKTISKAKPAPGMIDLGAGSRILQQAKLNGLNQSSKIIVDSDDESDWQ